MPNGPRQSSTSGPTNRVSSVPPETEVEGTTLSGWTKRRCPHVRPACKVRGGVHHLGVPRRTPYNIRFAADGTRVPRRSSCASASRLETVDKSSSRCSRHPSGRGSSAACSPHLGAKCAQAPNLGLPLLFHLFPRPARAETLATRFDVPCSGVNATTKRLLSLRIMSTTPIVGGLPRLTQLSPSLAPHVPYASICTFIPADTSLR